MDIQEIFNALPSFDDAQLRSLNGAVVATLNARRTLRSATKAASIIVGGTYILSGIRPKHLNGQKVIVTELRRTRAVVKSITGLSLGTVPASCLT